MARAPASALVAVLVVRLADEWAFFLPAGTLESFRADLGLTYTQAATVLAAVAPGALAGSAFSVAADRGSRRLIAAGGALGMAAALVAFGLAGSFWALVAAALAMGAASTAMVDAAEVALVDLAGDDLRRYLARSNLLGTVGDLLGPAALAVLAAAGLSWRTAFLASAAAMALYGVVLARAPLPGPRPADAGEGDGPGDRRPPFTAVLADPRVWLLGLIGLLLNLFDEPLVGFTIALLEQERGASATVATVVALVGLSGGLLTYTVLARRLATADDDRLLVAAGAMMGGGAVAIAVLPVLAAVAVAAFVVSVGLNLAWLALQHRSLTLRPGQAGATQAVLSAIELSGFWIPVGVGALADRAGLVPAVGVYGLLGAALAGLARALRGRARVTGSMDVLELDRRAAATVEALVAGVAPDRWTAATPCAEWTVGDLVTHLVAGNVKYTGIGAGGDWHPDVPDVELGDDPAATYRRTADEMTEAWSIPGRRDREIALPRGRRGPADVALWIHLAETLVHGWDLAVATGQKPAFDDDVVEASLADCRGRIPAERGPGSFFADARPTTADATALEQLAAYLGRDVPAWV